MAKKSFKDYTPRQQVALGAVTVVGLALVAVAEVDLVKRDQAEVRGPKLVWQLACLNSTGAVTYFMWGRKPPGAMA